MDALPPHPKHWYFGTKLVPPKLNSSSVYKSGVCLFCRYAHWTIGASSWWQMGHIYQTNPFDFPKGDRVDRWTNKHHQPETHTHTATTPYFPISSSCEGVKDDTMIPKKGALWLGPPRMELSPKVWTHRESSRPCFVKVLGQLNDASRIDFPLFWNRLIYI